MVLVYRPAASAAAAPGGWLCGCVERWGGRDEDGVWRRTPTGVGTIGDGTDPGRHPGDWAPVRCIDRGRRSGPSSPAGLDRGPHHGRGVRGWAGPGLPREGVVGRLLSGTLVAGRAT